MRCKCGNEIRNVPEHLRGLADWVCQQCSTSAPRSGSYGMSSEDNFDMQIKDFDEKHAA